MATGLSYMDGRYICFRFSSDDIPADDLSVGDVVDLPESHEQFPVPYTSSQVRALFGHFAIMAPSERGRTLVVHL